MSSCNSCGMLHPEGYCARDSLADSNRINYIVVADRYKTSCTCNWGSTNPKCGYHGINGMSTPNYDSSKLWTAEKLESIGFEWTQKSSTNKWHRD